MTQQYSLRWNNHQPNFISMFTTLLNTQTLVDVTLAAEGKHLQAHKVVLSACSTYFQALFVDNPSRHPIVILKDVTFADLRTMVDFMYYGEVNVTEEQLPQVLDTAKTLKIKGLTEMPDSTSLTRAQGTSTDFPTDPQDPPRHNVSPTNSPRRKRSRRRSSNGSTQMNAVGDENRADEAGSSMDMMRADAITLSSVPQRRARDYHDDRNVDAQAQNTEQQNMNVEAMTLETDAAGMPQGAETSAQASVRLRRSKNFKRQSRVPAEEPLRKQASEPTAAPSHHQPTLQKHESYPQYSANKYRRVRTQDPEVGTLFIRAVTMACSASTSSESEAPAAAAAARASHTPAVRSGPPLSCNYCWNTVDECGRILRRKTQYHCPECRTNLCIVPCFHEYHDGTDPAAAASARLNESPWFRRRPFSPRPNRDPYSPRPLRMRRYRPLSRPFPNPRRISSYFPSRERSPSPIMDNMPKEIQE